MSKLIVLNSKGGVCKSTVAMQILVPFLYERNGKTEPINLVEFDDENEDSKTFDNNSEIVKAKRYTLSGNDLDSALTDTVIDNDNLIVDVGGNKTSTYMLQSLKNTNTIDMFDCVVIPLTDGEQDAINALKVYTQIRALSEEIKVVFVLGRVDPNMDLEIQFLDFFGDIKGRIDDEPGYFDKIAKKDRNIIMMNNSESIKASRRFGITVYELAKTDIDNLSSKMKQYIQEGNKEKVKKVSYRITIVNKAITYINDNINKCFCELEKIISKKA